jgi:hypothetical protein
VSHAAAASSGPRATTYSRISLTMPMYSRTVLVFSHVNGDVREVDE